MCFIATRKQLRAMKKAHKRFHKAKMSLNHYHATVVEVKTILAGY